jgi:hypothetical protein
MRASYTRSKRDRPRAARAIPAARGNPALSKNALLIIAMARRLAAGDRWFESIFLQRRVRCEPIFPPGPKAGPKTRGGAHEPLTQIKQFLSAAHHLLSK